MANPTKPIPASLRAWEQVWIDSANGVSVQKRGDEYRLVHPIGFTVHFDPDFQASIRASSDVPPIFCSLYLEEQVHPRVRSHLGQLVLHAAFVELDPHSGFLIMGDTGRGKSTLATSFYLDGYSLAGDDAIEVEFRDGRAFGRSLNCSVRLNEDSVAHFSELHGLEAGSAGGGKSRFVPIGDEVEPTNVAKLIRAVFVIESNVTNVPVTRKLLPSEATIALVGSSFALDPSDKIRASKRLKQSALIAEPVPIFGLSVPHDFSMLSQVKAMVLQLLADREAVALLGQGND